MRIALLFCTFCLVSGQLTAQVTCPAAIAALEVLVPSEGFVQLKNSQPETGKVIGEKYRLKGLIEARLMAESIPIRHPKDMNELEDKWVIVSRFEYVSGPTKKGKDAPGEQQWRGDIVIGKVKSVAYPGARRWRGTLDLVLETKDGKEIEVSIWSRYPEREVFVLPAE